MEVDLRLRVAASKLFKYFGKCISIKLSNNSLCDLIVENENEHFIFGVKVGGSSFTTSKEFLDYISLLHNLTTQDFDFPLIAACVNINTEEVRVGMLSSFSFDKLIIFQNPQLVVLNERNGNILYDNIKALDKIIRILRNDNWGIVKEITIVEEIHHIGVLGHLVYLRTFNDQYKFQPPKLEKDKNKFERFSFDISQKEYPQDLLDDIILRGVKQIYTEAKVSVKSSLLLFNTELRELNHRISNYQEPRKITFQIEPDIDEYILKMGFFDSYRLTLNLYPELPYKNEIWRDETVVIQLTNKEWIFFSNNLRMGKNIRNISAHLFEERN